MNKKSIAAITSVLILILIGCSGKESNDADSQSNEVSKTNVNIDSSDAKSEDDDAKTDNVIQISAGKNSSSKNPDSLVKYNGKDLSVLNDAEAVLAELGDYDPKLSCIDDEYKNYVFSTAKIQFDTAIIDGKEASVLLYIYNPDIKTSKNVGLGNSEQDVLDAYGFPDATDSNDPSYSFEYHFPSFDLIFDFETESQTVEMIRYKNTNNHSKAAP